MKKYAVVGLLILSTCLSLISPLKSSALSPGYGRGKWYGYFYDRLDQNGPKVYPNGMYFPTNNTGSTDGFNNPKNDLKAESYMDRANRIFDRIEWEYRNGDQQHRTGSAYMINIILERDGWQAQRNLNNNEINEARNRLIDFVQSGGEVVKELTWFTVNTYYQNDHDDVAWYVGCSADARQADGTCASEAYRFIKNGVSYLDIKINCANPINIPVGIPQTNDRPTSVTLNIDCNGRIWGRATDPDRLGQPVEVEIWKTPYGVAGGRILNAANIKSDGAGNYSYTVSSADRNLLIDGTIVHAYAVNFDKNGARVNDANTWGHATAVASDQCYELKPLTSADKTDASIGEKITFTHNVDNPSPVNSYAPSDPIPTWWAIKQFVVPPNVSVNDSGPTWGSQGYFDRPPGSWSGGPVFGLAVDCIMYNAINLIPTMPCVAGSTIKTIKAQPRMIPARTTVEVDKAIIDTEDPMFNGSIVPGAKLCQLLAVDPPAYISSGLRHRWGKPVCVTISKSPSMKVTTGDVVVGRGGGASKITTLSHSDSVGGCFGSWLEYAAAAPGVIAPRTISGSSLNNPNCGTDADRARMSFANRNAPATPVGGFNTGVQPDLYGPAFGGLLPKVTMGNASIDLSTYTTSGSTIHIKAGDITVHGTVNKGVTIIIDAANITIDGNITYDGGSFSSLSDIPQLVLHSNGKIVINDNVSEVAGWLVATGNVSTCGYVDLTAAGTKYHDGLSTTVCNNPLKINGSIVADKLLLRRTGGSQGTTLADKRKTAEHINFRGDIQLWGAGRSAGNTSLKTQYIQELAPRF